MISVYIEDSTGNFRFWRNIDFTTENLNKENFTIDGVNYIKFDLTGNAGPNGSSFSIYLIRSGLDQVDSQP